MTELTRNITVRFEALLAILILFPFMVSAQGSGVQNDLGIQVIPKPCDVQVRPGYFIITSETTIVHDKESSGFAESLQQAIAGLSGTVCALKPDEEGSLDGNGHKEDKKRADDSGRPENKENTIELRIDPSISISSNEGYRLEATSDRVRLQARHEAGLFNGIQTLKQLLPIRRIVGLPNHLIEWRIPCCTIKDFPRFSWRGLMLDCSRTFQSMDYLMATIDRMAFYKMNVLHLHLTDDQGWRLEIKKYPELTGKGARFPDHWNEPEAHQGFYTQQQMKDLVAYAAARNITIVPEIEMPGHTLAVLACYPELSCTGGPFEIHPFFKGPGIHSDIFCAGKEETFRFLEGVLDEVIEIFPSPYIHIGGDEAPKVRWEACGHCQARMKTENLKDGHELQSWFIRRIARYVESKGRKIIGWDEILEGGLAEGAGVMSWRGVKGGMEAARAGHPVVMSPTSHCYFDYRYESIDTARAFAFDPVQGMTDDQAGCVLGLQANFWSHIDREPAKVDRQLFPRLLSIAERGWASAKENDPDEFIWRVRIHLAHLDEMAIAYDRKPLDRSSLAVKEGNDDPGEDHATKSEDES